jgi:predicted RNase H-like HicB family nuclease
MDRLGSLPACFNDLDHFSHRNLGNKMLVLLHCGEWGVEKSRFMNIIKTDNGDIFVADCPEVGTVSQGYSFDEAVANLKEATELFLEVEQTVSFERSIVTTFDVMVHA